MSQTDYTLTKDTYIDESNPTTNYGTSTTLIWGHIVANKVAEGHQYPVLYTDISALAADQVITAAVLRLYVTSHTSGGATLVEMRRNGDDGWIESEADWEEKSNGVAWTGGDGGTPLVPYPAVQDDPAATGQYWELEVGCIAGYAQKVNSGIFNFLGFLYTGASTSQIVFYSKESASNKPMLRLTHETHGRQVISM